MKSLSVFFILLLAANIQAQQSTAGDFVVIPIAKGSEIQIYGYMGKGGSVRIPPRINNRPVTEIFSWAFQKKGLTGVSISNSVTKIGSGAFSENGLRTVVIPNRVTYIGQSAFRQNRLTSVTITNSVVSIAQNAFQSNRLTSVTIPRSVAYIGGYAFNDNNITRIVIGNDVMLDEIAFDYSFAAYYNANDRKAGTYTYRNGRWSVGNGLLSLLADLFRLPARMSSPATFISSEGSAIVEANRIKESDFVFYEDFLEMPSMNYPYNILGEYYPHVFEGYITDCTALPIGTMLLLNPHPRERLGKGYEGVPYWFMEGIEDLPKAFISKDYKTNPVAVRVWAVTWKGAIVIVTNRIYKMEKLNRTPKNTYENVNPK